MRNWAIPNDVRELRRFLGIVSYYRRYIHHFADIAGPLHQLTQKQVPFTWSAECQKAFKQLKKSLSIALSWRTHSFTRMLPNLFCTQMRVNLDWGVYVLEQDNRVVAYASRSLIKAEKHYSVIQKECLAIVFGTKQFRHHLLGWSFKLYTDHAPLQ